MNPKRETDGRVAIILFLMLIGIASHLGKINHTLQLILEKL